MKKDYPKNIEEWMRILSDIDIPILQMTQKVLTSDRNNISNLDLRDIATIIKHDSLLSLRLFKYQKTKQTQVQTKDVTTIERILLMIGIEKFFKVFSTSQTLESCLKDDPEALNACHQTCARSYFASQLANEMSKYRHDIDQNEIISAVLLHETAEILMWQIAPKPMLEISRRLKADSTLRSAKIQNDILGCSLNELQQRLINQWQLPKILSHLIYEDFSVQEEPRVQLTQLATAIARHTEWAWHSERTEQDLKKCTELLRINHEEAHQLIVKAALKTAHQWQWYGVEPTIIRLLET